MLVMVSFLLAQYYKLAVMAPPPEYIWDNVYLWDFARNISFGNFATFVTDSHHHLRWGNWAFAAVLIQLFSDEVLFYYLATAIPSIIASLVFIYITWRYVGTWQSAIFAILWFFDGELFRATFQLLPTGQSLLPISIIALLLIRAKTINHLGTGVILCVSLCVFWLYGVKETYLAFAPAIALIMWQLGGIRALATLGFVMVIGYGAETLMFKLMNSDFSLLGRIHAVINGEQHVQIMLTHDYFVAEQTQYFDSGITMRWVAAVGVSSIIYFPAFLLSVLVLANNHKDSAVQYNQLDVTASMLLISFMFFTTFFIISITPLRLGQTLVSRYLAIALPFSYILILSFVSNHLKNASFRFKLAALSVVPFLIAPAINRFASYSELSIVEISNRYASFGKKFSNYNCVRAKQKSIVRNQLDLIPVQYRSPNAKAMIANPQTIHIDNHFLVKATDRSCKKTYTIARGEAARY